MRRREPAPLRAAPPQRVGARLVTGPAARGLAFCVDLGAALVRTARGRPEHPEERRD